MLRLFIGVVDRTKTQGLETDVITSQRKWMWALPATIIEGLSLRVTYKKDYSHYMGSVL